MKLTIEVNGKPAVIELTPDQIESVKKHSVKITDRVKTFGDACAVLGISAPKSILQQEFAIGAFVKLQIIAKALNEGWQPDWNNSGEYKYYSWFDMRNGFSYDGYVCYDSYSHVCSRFCYRTRELAEYAGKQFEDLYKELYVISV